MNIEVYTTRWCGYCFAAKRLLEKLGLGYTEIAVDEDWEKRAWLVEQSGQRTVPQIFIDGRSIGGYRELSALVAAGGLKSPSPRL